MNPITILILAVAALAVGPITADALRRHLRLHALLDGFVLAMVGVLCLTTLLPHAYEVLGMSAFAAALVGFFLPHFAEKRIHDHRHGEPGALLFVAFIGLLVHAAVDGGVLGANSASHSNDDTLNLGLAIVLHRLPVGLFVWWTLRPGMGRGIASLVLVGLAAATGLGFFISDSIAPLAEGIPSGILHAILSGGLLHIIMDHGPMARGVARHRSFSALGAIAGIVMFILLPGAGDRPILIQSLRTSADLLMESSFAIVLGFLGAGALSLVPTAAMARLMTGRNSFTSALRGVIFGIPLPVCSCGVVPLYRSLAHKGVPAAAAMAFLVATPELGMDALIISVPLLGIRMAALRLVAAIIVAMAAGVAAGWLLPTPKPTSSAEEIGDATTGSRWNRALRYGLVESVDDLGPWIFLGIILAGFLEPLLVPELVELLPKLLEIPFFALLATPLYICASGATPVAAVLLVKGVSAGAVVAFLITGPATNITTFGAIRTTASLGKTWILVLVIPMASILVGYVFELLGWGASVSAPVLSDHGHAPWRWVFSVFFALMLLASLLRQGPRGFLQQLGLGDDHGHDHSDEDGHDHHPSEKHCC